MSIMEQFGYPSEATAKRSLFEVMKENGAAYLEAHYSGGNDEGGVDSIDVLKDADGNAIPIPEQWITREPKEGDNAWSIRDGKVHEYHPLYEAADEMLSTEFGSWAGEFSAYGTLFADVKAGKVWRAGEQSAYYDDSHDY